MFTKKISEMEVLTVCVPYVKRYFQLHQGNFFPLEVRLLRFSQRNTNADLKISLDACVDTKAITCKFRLLNPKNPRIICP